jgi:hypothetical protein
LNRPQAVGDPKSKTKEIKFPQTPSFHSQSRNKKNLLILAKHDARRLARRAGLVTCEGFNYAAKANYQVPILRNSISAESFISHFYPCILD